jgi:DNA primase
LRPARPAAFRASGPSRGGERGAARRGAVPETALPQTRASVLARVGTDTAGREAAVLLILLAHPALALECCDEVAGLSFGRPDLDEVRAALISAAALPEASAAPETLRATVAAMLGADPVERVGAAAPPGAAALAGAGPSVAAAGLREALARLAAESRLRRETAEAEAALAAGGGGAEVDRRLAQAAAMAGREIGASPPGDDGGEAQLSASLRAAIADEIWVKRKRARPDSNR